MDFPNEGRERDTAIAKLKGIKKISQSSEKFEEGRDQSDYFMYYIPSGKPWRTHAIDARLLPFWSTDRKDAWELWDELCKAYPMGMLYSFTAPDQHTVETDMSNEIVAKGTSFPDCVTKAWLIWKGDGK